MHVVQELLEQDRRVRAFVRTPAELLDHLASCGVDADHPRLEVASGDMTDRASVTEAVVGCDEVVHAAATFSYRRRDAESMVRDNELATTTVLDAAIGAGCSANVHVSSIAALLRPGATLDADSPVGMVIGPYTQSKVDSERVARTRQDAGAPLAIVNPGAILRPHDPYLGESNQVVRDILRARLPTWPRGGMR